MSNFHLEDRVLVLGKPCPGTLAFMGNTSFSKGMWFGIMLDEPIGRNNGSYGGVQYFKCPKSHGVFVRPCQVTKIVDDSDNQLSAHNASKNHPNYLKKAPVSSKKSTKASKPDSLVGVTTRKKRREFGTKEDSSCTGKPGEEKCVLVNETDGSNNGSYEVVQYLKYPKNHEIFAKHRQVTKIPIKSNTKSATPSVSSIYPNYPMNFLTSIPTIRNTQTSVKGASSNSEIQQKCKEFITKDSMHNSSTKVHDKVDSNLENTETISKVMENCCKISDSDGAKENKSLTNSSRQSIGKDCFSPELQRFFSKTHNDVTEIKEYINELDEKLKILKTNKFEK